VKGLTLAQPKGAPGLEGWIYDYGLLVELMVTSFWAGRYVESAAACDRLLREGLIPPQMREGILGNRAALDKKLQGVDALAAGHLAGARSAAS
jgi:hypothetical protein